MIFKEQMFDKGKLKMEFRLAIGQVSTMSYEGAGEAIDFLDRCIEKIEEAKKCLLDNDYRKAKYPDIDS